MLIEQALLQQRQRQHLDGVCRQGVEFGDREHIGAEVCWDRVEMLGRTALSTQLPQRVFKCAAEALPFRLPDPVGADGEVDDEVAAGDHRIDRQRLGLKILLGGSRAERVERACPAHPPQIVHQRQRPAAIAVGEQQAGGETLAGHPAQRIADAAQVGAALADGTHDRVSGGEPADGAGDLAVGQRRDGLRAAVRFDEQRQLGQRPDVGRCSGDGGQQDLITAGAVLRSRLEEAAEVVLRDADAVPDLAGPGGGAGRFGDAGRGGGGAGRGCEHPRHVDVLDGRQRLLPVGAVGGSGCRVGKAGQPVRPGPEAQRRALLTGRRTGQGLSQVRFDRVPGQRVNGNVVDGHQQLDGPGRGDERSLQLGAAGQVVVGHEARGPDCRLGLGCCRVEGGEVPLLHRHLRQPFSSRQHELAVDDCGGQYPVASQQGGQRLGHAVLFGSAERQQLRLVVVLRGRISAGEEVADDGGGVDGAGCIDRCGGLLACCLQVAGQCLQGCGAHDRTGGDAVAGAGEFGDEQDRGDRIAADHEQRGAHIHWGLGIAPQHPLHGSCERLLGLGARG